MGEEETGIKRYVVKLSEEERNRLEGMIHSGKHPAQRLMKARILLNADTSEAGEGWNDKQIAQARCRPARSRPVGFGGNSSRRGWIRSSRESIRRTRPGDGYSMEPPRPS